MDFFGKVTRVSGDNVYVEVSEIAGNAELGPFPAIEVWRFTNDIDGHLVPHKGYQKGDRVIVSRMGHMKERMVVIGRLI